MSVKPGKARKLNYMSQLSVDTGDHVITDIKAYHADKRDNQYLPDTVGRLRSRLNLFGLLWRNCVADTGYSSGENYAFLEQINLVSFIPPHGTYKGGPNGFVHDLDQDHYVCPEGEIIPFKKVFNDYKTGRLKKEYRGSTYQCRDCPIKKSCLGKTAKEKKFSVTYFKAEYERNIARVESNRGRYMKGKRQSTVEPVFGTLTQFMGLRKINTIGIKQANKVMHLSAIAYNLKKYLKFVQKLTKSEGKALGVLFFEIMALYKATNFHLSVSKLR
ncbi:transposase [Olleya sp. HaHaR_3_96]|uniref:transposase n=1 Tax=Olleya sp. HaHaR_3_96 TaxID=2745560 RepID=UPI00211A1BE4|nr:transposase [Olleya sp. HaHaR_3_96]